MNKMANYGLFQTNQDLSSRPGYRVRFISLAVGLEGQGIEVGGEGMLYWLRIVVFSVWCKMPVQLRVRLRGGGGRLLGVDGEGDLVS